MGYFPVNIYKFAGLCRPPTIMDCHVHRGTCFTVTRSQLHSSPAGIFAFICISCKGERYILFDDEGEMTKRKVVFTLGVSDRELLEIRVIYLRNRSWRKIKHASDMEQVLFRLW